MRRRPAYSLPSAPALGLLPTAPPPDLLPPRAAAWPTPIRAAARPPPTVPPAGLLPIAPPPGLLLERAAVRPYPHRRQHLRSAPAAALPPTTMAPTTHSHKQEPPDSVVLLHSLDQVRPCRPPPPARLRTFSISHQMCFQVVPTSSHGDFLSPYTVIWATASKKFTM
ncbi:hypothetical protein VPH35_088027 [Triticum aestivum]